MKKIFGIVAVTALVLASATSCKSSSESAYKKAYEKAQAAKQAANQSATAANQVAVDATQTAQNATHQATTAVTQPVQTTVSVPTTENNDVRRINGTITVLDGGTLDTYSVVVGSFTVEVNARGLLTTLKNSGYPNAQIIKTNETINGHTGWYRVIATTHSTRDAAAASRNGLRGKYAGAWLLAK